LGGGAVNAELAIPDPRVEPIPFGWAEAHALPVLKQITDWDSLDEYEAKANAVISLIESMGGDATEIHKVNRVVDWRRGVWLGVESRQGQRTDLQLHRPNGEVRVPQQRASEYRQIARWWPQVWDNIRGATTWREATRKYALRLIAQWLNSDLVTEAEPVDRTGEPFPTIVLDPPWD